MLVGYMRVSLDGDRAVAASRKVEEAPDHLLARLSPLGWEHVNLTGDYAWAPTEKATETHDGFRLLRVVPDDVRLAA